MEQLLLRPNEAAAVLGVGRSKIYALIAAGMLPTVRLGGSLRIPARSLQRWVEESVDGRPEPRRVPPDLADEKQPEVDKREGTKCRSDS